MGSSHISIAEEMAKKIRDKSDVVCNFYQLDEDGPDPRELSAVKKNLMVFDNLLLEKQNTGKRIMSEEDTATSIVAIYLKTISSSHAKQSQRRRISFVCFPKTWRTLTTFSIIMWEVTWLRKNSDNYARQLGKNNTGL